mgnify:CR=1 FL=1
MKNYLKCLQVLDADTKQPKANLILQNISLAFKRQLTSRVARSLYFLISY